MVFFAILDKESAPMNGPPANNLVYQPHHFVVGSDTVPILSLACKFTSQNYMDVSLQHPAKIALAPKATAHRLDTF